MQGCSNQPGGIELSIGKACQLCWEELSSAPCLQLTCGHLCHAHCAQEQLQKVPAEPPCFFHSITCGHSCHANYAREQLQMVSLNNSCSVLVSPGVTCYAREQLSMGIAETSTMPSLLGSSCIRCCWTPCTAHCARKQLRKRLLEKVLPRPYLLMPCLPSAWSISMNRPSFTSWAGLCHLQAAAAERVVRALMLTFNCSKGCKQQLVPFAS